MWQTSSHPVPALCCVVCHSSKALAVATGCTVEVWLVDPLAACWDVEVLGTASHCGIGSSCGLQIAQHPLNVVQESWCNLFPAERSLGFWNGEIWGQWVGLAALPPGSWTEPGLSLGLSLLTGWRWCLQLTLPFTFSRLTKGEWYLYLLTSEGFCLFVLWGWEYNSGLCASRWVFCSWTIPQASCFKMLFLGWPWSVCLSLLNAWILIVLWIER